LASKTRKLYHNTLQIRCFYAMPRRFLNRVPKFDSWRGQLVEAGIGGRGGKAATPPGRYRKRWDAACGTPRA